MHEAVHVDCDISNNVRPTNFERLICAFESIRRWLEKQRSEPMNSIKINFTTNGSGVHLVCMRHTCASDLLECAMCTSECVCVCVWHTAHGAMQWMHKQSHKHLVTIFYRRDPILLMIYACIVPPRTEHMAWFVFSLARISKMHLSTSLNWIGSDRGGNEQRRKQAWNRTWYGIT